MMHDPDQACLFFMCNDVLPQMHNEGTEGLDFMVGTFSKWIEAHPPNAQ
jgi:hypothetical protein